eukprot:TRINITY_DN5176_c0_g2_i1.p1 TRINITY_DN5176_c0_g2~~TRINITY_DN5176_c0_g2_i1.p1  ORF type:complete len:188 (-),score=39.62 TRINITY_DN5176_c0_g2_i1:27-557(-)
MAQNISFKDLSPLFDKPIAEAAKLIGVCATVLKKKCRDLGIPRWPYRKITSIDRMINTLEGSLKTHPNARILHIELITLKAHRQYIIDHPESIDKRTGAKKRKRNGDFDGEARKSRRLVDDHEARRMNAKQKIETIDPVPEISSDYIFKGVPRGRILTYPQWFEEEFRSSFESNKS